MKTYQYKPDAPASACIWRINNRTHSLARRACIGQVRFHLLIALFAEGTDHFAALGAADSAPSQEINVVRHKFYGTVRQQ